MSIDPRTPTRPIPPLENGDTLTRDEFERRYHAMPHVKKAELIEGVVYMPSPVSAGYHGHPDGRMATWVGTYEIETAGSFMASKAHPGLVGPEISELEIDAEVSAAQFAHNLLEDVTVF